jgi:catechol 2,3-dioxygenase-like lactoylglutathione lyase family enzyme
VLTSVLIDDRAKALAFCSDALGFRPKADGHPAARPFKAAVVEDGIPFASFGVEDVQAEYERLRALGVRFTQRPAAMGPVVTAVLDDTCGNLLQITAATRSG